MIMVSNTGADYKPSQWWVGSVQAMATGLGMSSTSLAQPFMGCGFRGVPGGVRNQLTLADAARLYAAVDNGTVLSGSTRELFFAILLGGPPSATDAWGQVVAQEAASLGKSAVVPRFLAQLDVRWKGRLVHLLHDRRRHVHPVQAGSGHHWLDEHPVRTGRHARLPGLRFGDFVNDLYLPCRDCAAARNAGNLLQGVAAEAARPHHQAGAHDLELGPIRFRAGRSRAPPVPGPGFA